MRQQGGSQFKQRITQSSVFPGVACRWLELLDMPEQGFAVVRIEIKNNHVESGFWRMGLVLTGVPVTDSLKFSFNEFVSLFSESELQWCATTEGDFRLGQPGVGSGFVAKDLLS